jgi:Holliday junction DNA helicase RuvB
MTITFDGFIGNVGVTEKLQLLIGPAIESGGKLPHLLFLGPTGNGKTKMVSIIAAKASKRLVYMNSVAIKDAMVFRGIITHPENMKHGAIIFIDECHRLPTSVQDHLLSVLEEPAELVTVSKGVVVRDDLPDHMTFVFATTHGGFLNETLVNRLETVEFSEYSVEEKEAIAGEYLLNEHGITSEMIDAEALKDIGRRCRSARHVTRVCDNVIRFMKLRKVDKMNAEAVAEVFKILAIDPNGLTPRDGELLRFLAKNGRCGLDTLEAFLNVPKKDIREKMEPFLLRRGLIERSASGRALTPNGHKALAGDLV